MKTSGLLIIYISENEEFDLWRVLSQIPPEERNAYVKNALRSTLLKNKGVPVQAVAEVASSREPLRQEMDSAEAEILDRELSNQAEVRIIPEFNTLNLEDFNLNDLYADSSKQAKNVISFELAQTAQNTSGNGEKASVPGLANLLNSVIGEENDPMLLEFLKGKRDLEES